MSGDDTQDHGHSEIWGKGGLLPIQESQLPALLETPASSLSGSWASILGSHGHAKSLQSYSTFGNPMDCSPPGSPVHGILQARALEWVAIASSRGSSQPRD